MPRHDVDKSELTIQVILATFSTHGLLLAAGDDLVAEYGITSARWQVMGAIALAGRPLTVPQIARRMGLSRQSVHVSIGRLVDSGLVELVPNADHQRSQLVALTPAGASLYRKLDERQRAWAARLSAGIEPADLQIAARVLEQLSARLTNGEDQEGAKR